MTLISPIFYLIIPDKDACDVSVNGFSHMELILVMQQTIYLQVPVVQTA